MSDLPTSNLDSIADRIREELGRKHEARESAYPLSRQVVRSSANAIRAVHRHEFETAKDLLSQAASQLREIAAATVNHPELNYAGYVDTAQKEFAEANITLALASGSPLPEPEDLDVAFAPYLNGLGEGASEMRRHLLDALRHDDVSRCEDLLASMDDIYNVLVTMDFPDALTGNLRRTTDMVRAVLERTRGDLTLAIGQRRLAEKLTRVEERLASRE